MHKFNFSYEKLVDLLQKNEKNYGSEKGDGGRNRDALILCYFLIQKYGGKELLDVVNRMNTLAELGLDYIASEVISQLDVS